MEKLIFKKIIRDISLFLFISITCVATIVWIIQAVNYLDLVSEDGHSLKVYFAYTLFSLPKILSNILPFMFMISLFYVIISYEINNERKSKKKDAFSILDESDNMSNLVSEKVSPMKVLSNNYVDSKPTKASA